MAGTRASARLSASSKSSSPPASSPKDLKRKAGSPSSSPQAKRGRKDDDQKTIEDTMPGSVASTTGKSEGDGQHEMNNDVKDDDGPKASVNGDDDGQESNNEATAEQKPDHTNAKGGAVVSSQSRADNIPSNLLEKGIIYFFARGRVGVDDPSDVKDIARSYIVLRPLPKDAKLTDGVLDDVGNNRLLAIPKKVLPQSHRDAFMVFVEKAMTTTQDLRDNFMKGSDYDTKTTGTSHSPPVTPLAEGVYAITTQGRDSHLAYMLTIPQEIGQVQQSMGLKEKGSFILSAKNPEQSGPANASLPEKPGFPKDIMDDFQGRRWMGLQPRHLDYANAQCLFIGEGAGEFRRAAEKTDRDEQNDKTSPGEEVENLEGEDAHRAKALDGDHTIFSDLGISQKEYPKVKTTW